MFPQKISEASFIDSLRYIGKGDENAVFLKQKEEGERTPKLIFRICHKNPSVVRKPCLELVGALKCLTPKYLGICSFVGEAAKKILQRLSKEVVTKEENEQKQEQEEEKEEEENHNELVILATVTSCAFLTPLRFEIKPKWGFRALVDKVNILGTSSSSTSSSFELASTYVTESKYTLKQKYRFRDTKNFDFSQLRYHPEKLFSSVCCNNDEEEEHEEKKTIEIVKQCLLDLDADQKLYPRRNNFSSTFPDSSSSSSATEVHFHLAAVALVKSGVLSTLANFQRFGEEVGKEKKQKEEEGEKEEDVEKIPIVPEAPLVEFLVNKRKQESSSEFRVKFSPSVPSSPSSFPSCCWNQQVEKRMIKRLYNATAARDVTIVISFSFDPRAKENSKQFCLQEKQKTQNEEEEKEEEEEEEEEEGTFVFGSQLLPLRVKVSVIDLDDKSDYKTISQIRQNDAKLFSPS